MPRQYTLTITVPDENAKGSIGTTARQDEESLYKGYLTAEDLLEDVENGGGLWEWNVRDLDAKEM
jgi:hypothetical protein